MIGIAPGDIVETCAWSECIASCPDTSSAASCPAWSPWYGDTHVETLGTMAGGGAKPMRRDAIFRIASITKPITAAAAMILIEDCRLRLDDPIDPWLPELANRRVLRSLASQPDETVPALRPITVRDLLTSRMGFGSVMAMPDTYPIQRLIRDQRIGGDGPPHPAQALPTDEWLRNLGSLPWLAQPAYNDPSERLITILLTQRLMDSPEPPKHFSDFFTTAYAALE